MFIGIDTAREFFYDVVEVETAFTSLAMTFGNEHSESGVLLGGQAPWEPLISTVVRIWMMPVVPFFIHRQCTP